MNTLERIAVALERMVEQNDIGIALNTKGLVERAASDDALLTYWHKSDERAAAAEQRASDRAFDETLIAGVNRVRDTAAAREWLRLVENES